MQITYSYNKAEKTISVTCDTPIPDRSAVEIVLFYISGDTYNYLAKADSDSLTVEYQFDRDGLYKLVLVTVPIEVSMTKENIIDESNIIVNLETSYIEKYQREKLVSELEDTNTKRLSTSYWNVEKILHEIKVQFEISNYLEINRLFNLLNNIVK